MIFVRLFLLLFSVVAGFAQEAVPYEPQHLPPEPPRSPGEFSGGYSRDRVVFGAFTLREDETVRDLVVVGGDAKVFGRVEGDLIVLGGKAVISGTVERDAVTILGSLQMMEGARINEDVILLGGPFDLDGGSIAGERLILPIGDFIPQIEWFKEWLKSCLVLGRLLSFDLVWPWMLAGFFFMLYAMLLLVFPGAVRGTVHAIEERPVASLFAGLLTMVFFAPFVVVLAVSVVGILIIPFLVLALIVITFFGKTAVLCCIGRGVSRNVGIRILEHPVFAFLIGAVLLALAYTVPICGVIAFAAATVFGLGGAMVALTSNFSREESSIPAIPVPAGSVRLAAPAGQPAGAGSGNPLEQFTAAAAIHPADTILLPRAGFWKRTAAGLLDMVLLSLLVPFLGPLIIPVGVAYFVAMWTWKGTTVGSIVLGLKVVRTDGSAMNFAVALVRSLSSIFSAMVFFIGFFWAGWDREKQSWHDKIAGTVVVQMPADFALI